LPLWSLPHANDAQALRNYVEEYQYDFVGNIEKMIHTAVGSAAGSWTRRYAYGAAPFPNPPPQTPPVPENNRLHSTSLPGDAATGPYSATYSHDANGNMLSMPHLASITYSHKNQMRAADLGGGGTAYYTYDASGERVRKVIQRLGTTREERIYLGGWELYRKRQGAGAEVVLERETLHVMDDGRRIAMVETKTVDADVSWTLTVAPRTRYQLDNHLGTATLEVDETGLVISYEEYHPYGTSAYRSARSGVEVSEKRYQYTGKERDEETGFGYHSARYLAPWLGRWTSADPIGLQAGVNLYRYCAASPVVFRDPSGTDEVVDWLDFARDVLFPAGSLIFDAKTHKTQTKAFVDAFSDLGEAHLENLAHAPDAIEQALKFAKNLVEGGDSNRLTTATHPRAARWQAAQAASQKIRQIGAGAAVAVGLVEGVVEPVKQVVKHGITAVDPRSTTYDRWYALGHVTYQLPQAVATIATAAEGAGALRGSLSPGATTPQRFWSQSYEIGAAGGLGPEMRVADPLQVSSGGMVASDGLAAASAAPQLTADANLAGAGMGAAEIRPTFGNLFPGDVPLGRTAGTLAELQVGEATGTFDFVVQEGKVTLGEGHPYLAGGGRVDYAGSITLSEGLITRWTNASGHFRPAAQFAGQAGLPMSHFTPVQIPVFGGPVLQLPVFQ
jgi:RHS repeat-associated protein